MKKSARKLHLGRETVVNLATNEATLAAGGRTEKFTVCIFTCNGCPPSIFTDCTACEG